MSKAGFNFICGCCEEEHPEGEAKIDPQLNRPVCEHCRFLLLGATAWLKKARIIRPIHKTDITHENQNRLSDYTYD